MIPVFKPLIEDEELDAARAALEMGWLGMGSYVGEFERAIESELELGDRHVVALGTGHAALHLGLILAGVEPGDEVLTPAFNNISDFQAILATGAEPVLCDIDETTLCLDVEKARSLVGPRTRVVIAMDYGCTVADHDAVTRLADEHGLRVMHDAAHSFGSRHRGRFVGAFSDLCMFSFDPIKNVTCIDGGALVVRTEDEVQQLHELRMIGMGQPAAVSYQNRRAWTYDVQRQGFRYHLANLHAKVGLAQLGKLERIRQSRRATTRRYNEAFEPLPDVRTPVVDLDSTLPFLYYVRVPADSREAFRKSLADRGVETGMHWQPAHWFTLFKDRRQGDLSVTDRVAAEIVSLPMHPCMEAEAERQVIEAVRGFFA